MTKGIMLLCLFLPALSTSRFSTIVAGFSVSSLPLARSLESLARSEGKFQCNFKVSRFARSSRVSSLSYSLPSPAPGARRGSGSGSGSNGNSNR